MGRDPGRPTRHPCAARAHRDALDDREAFKEGETLGRVFRYIAAVVISLIAGMLVLGQLGVSVARILGAAGVVGLADYLRRPKRAFDERGIEIPFPQMRLHVPSVAPPAVPVPSGT